METWRPISGWPDYEVSDLGRVRRVTGGRGVRAGRVLRPGSQPNGYLGVNLYLNGVRTRRTVHSLVADAFLGGRPPGYEVNHLHPPKTDNRAVNLEVTTSAGNKAHAVATGLAAMGARNASTKLTDEEVIAIRAACAAGLSQRAVAAMFGVSQPHVSDLVLGKKRRAVPTAP